MLARVLCLPLLLTPSAWSQATGGAILGAVHDASGASISQARVQVRQLETNAAASDVTDLDGRFRFSSVPVGSYELTIEKPGFARYVQGPIVLRLNQEADLAIALEVAASSASVNVAADAPLVNTTSAEVGVNFDTRRVTELPLASGRNLLSLALSVAGVSQLGAGQQCFICAAGVDPSGTPGLLSFSVNGMRTRANNFIIDGQDANSLIGAGMNQPLNNPDLVADFRLITNQFAPEFGRATGSAVSIVTKSGTNQFHGSTFWFHDNQHFSARSNLEKQISLNPPFHVENQFGGTFGGPVVKDKTFYFISAQRWTDRRLAAGVTIRGVPTQAGRELLNSIAGDRQTVKILLDNLPAAQAPVSGLMAIVNVGGRSVAIPLGTLTGSSTQAFNDWQWSARVDHRWSDKHTLGGRILFDDSSATGGLQVTPPGLTTARPTRALAPAAFLNSSLSRALYSELRVSFRRTSTANLSENPAAERIPSIEVPELGLRGSSAGATRTGIGFNTSHPNSNAINNYQLQETLGWLHGTHAFKAGIDFRRQELKFTTSPIVRGQLLYNTLRDLVDDLAQTARIGSPLPASELVLHFRYYDYFFFLQDQWRVRPNLTLHYGIRYEGTGNSYDSLADLNRRIVAAAGGDQRYVYGPAPKRDNNNWAPRFGFNYRLTRDGRMVLRGGYARTYDFEYLGISMNVGGAFPFVRSDSLPANTPNSFDALRRVSSTPLSDAGRQNRTITSADFRSPYAEQFSLQLQRELKPDWAVSLGWIGTKGTALFETLDGNPTVPGSRGTLRLNPLLGVITERCNCASSIYHSLQASLEKRLSRGLSMAAHYTWSASIDTASDYWPTSVNGDVPIAQDAYNRRADRARASSDRPHRLAVNGVWELPLARRQKGVMGRVLGGWQLSGFLTFQSGAPFTVFDGTDPGFRMTGLIYNAIRANANTALPLSTMSVEDIVRAGGERLFAPVTAAAPLGNLGRNILRADGIGNLDLGFFKNTRLAEGRTLQFRSEFYNATNTRNFGVPDASRSSTNFLNQWGTDGGSRRMVLALRLLF